METKNYTNIINAIRNDITATKELRVQIKKFVIAIAKSRDKKILDSIYTLNKLGMKVEIIFWEDIECFIASDSALLNKYYPSIVPQKNRSKLLYLAFVGSQIAELIKLTLGDRDVAEGYCTRLKKCAELFDDSKTRDCFVEYVNGIMELALGDLQISDSSNDCVKQIFSYGKVIERYVETLSMDLNESDRNYYLVGYYLRKVFSMEEENDSRILERLIENLVNVIKEIDISEKNKEYIIELTYEMKDSQKRFGNVLRIFDFFEQNGFQ